MRDQPPLTVEQYTEIMRQLAQTVGVILANEPCDEGEECAAGVVTRLVLIVEVATSVDEKWLCVRATDAAGLQPKSWDVLGMLETAKGIVE